VQFLDLNIPQTATVKLETCSCFHPCDVANPKDELFWPKDPSFQFKPSKPIHKLTFDFFPSLEHCWARKQRCESERDKQLKLTEHAAYPTGATHAEAVSRALTDNPSVEDSSGYAGRVAGYVDENPPENFNELHFVYQSKKESSNEYSDQQGRSNELVR